MSDTSPGIEAKHYLLNQGVQIVYVWTSGEILQGSLEQNYTLKAECLCFPQKGFDSLWHCVVLQNNFYGLSYLVLYLVLKLFDITIRTPRLIPRLLQSLFEDMAKWVSEDAGCHCSASSKMRISHCGFICGCSWALSKPLNITFLFYGPAQCYCHRKVALNIRYVFQERKRYFSINFLWCLSVSSLNRMAQEALEGYKIQLSVQLISYISSSLHFQLL